MQITGTSDIANRVISFHFHPYYAVYLGLEWSTRGGMITEAGSVLITSSLSHQLLQLTVGTTAPTAQNQEV